ncbi:MAG: UDP-3-O-[3-hydroxymyristoyl] N-acetylglucosamine deacetylase [Synechococcus sp. NP17]|nr:UDP-3-O-[3-hydroxymyristoyl] N-acetylglucosamine deacetylase [Synechococcus sp. NP17]
MMSWPSDYSEGWTLASSVTRSGVGLHSGLQSQVTLVPTEQEGFYVRWLDQDSDPVRLDPSQVRESQLCTTLDFGDKQLSTVEHLLAALAGCGVSHVEVQVNGSEVPLLDGSALGWVEAIAEAGLSKALTPRSSALVLTEPLVFNRGGSAIIATPAERFRLVGVIDFPQKAIGRQQLAIELNPQRFVNDIAPARTFGFREQVEYLRTSGLIRGGALENALVCDGDTWMNPPLRFPDEPVRHKILDLIGDLALVGFPQAQVLAYRGSHGLHTDLAAALAHQLTSQR